MAGFFKAQIALTINLESIRRKLSRFRLHMQTPITPCDINHRLNMHFRISNLHRTIEQSWITMLKVNEIVKTASNVTFTGIVVETEKKAFRPNAFICDRI